MVIENMVATAPATNTGTERIAPCVLQSTTSRMVATSALMGLPKAVIQIATVNAATNETALVTRLLGLVMMDWRSVLVLATNSGSRRSAKIAILCTTLPKIRRHRFLLVVIAASMVTMVIRIADASVI